MRDLMRKAKDRIVSLSRKGRRYIPKEALMEADFLESILPLQVFATLTLPCNFSIVRLDGMFARWISGIQAHNGVTVGFIKAYERFPRRHTHAALVAAHTLDREHAALLWQSVIGRRSSSAAKVEPFRYGIGGVAYVMKSLDSLPEDVQFSHNISGFLPGAGRRFFGATSAERRHIRRIREQTVASFVAQSRDTTVSQPP
jgi:hypothetical protein